MNRLILIVSLLIAAISSVSAHRMIDLETNTIKEVESFEDTSPSRDVTVLEDGTVVVTYQFKNILILDDENPEKGVILSISGFGQNMKSGEASWPQRLDRILMPENSTAKLTIDEDSYLEFDLALKPAISPQINSETEINNTFDSVQFSDMHGGFEPLNGASEAGIAQYRGESSCKIIVNPVKYDPSSQKVRISKRIRYRLSFTPILKSQKAIAPREISTNLDFNELDPCIINFSLNAQQLTENPNKLIGNPPDIGNIQISGFKEQGYLIISNVPYNSAASRLAEWKTKMGFTVKIAIQPKWTSTSIYTTIKENYASMTNLKYVLLLGDFFSVPPIYKDFNGSLYPTDYHYGCMDDFENDYDQDIYIGRISARSLGDANIAVNKIIDYDRNPITDIGFYSRGIHCGEFQGSNGYEKTRTIKTSQEIYEYMTAMGKNITRLFLADPNVNPKYWNNTGYSFGERIPADLQRPNYSWNVTINDINQSLSKGAFYLFYNSHGAPTYWSMPQGIKHYSVENIGEVAQLGLPIVFSMACENGAFHYNNTPCFAEVLISSPKDGAAGVIASSGKSFSPYNDILATGLFDAMYPEPGLEPIFPYIANTYNSTPNKAVFSLGEILQHANLRLEERFGTINNDDPYINLSKEIYHIFGDPSMQIRTEYKGGIPFTIEPPSMGFHTKPGFTLNLTKAPLETIVTAYDEETGEVEHNNTRLFSYQTDHPERVTIYAHAHNYAPLVFKASSFAMEPLPIGSVIPVGITSMHKNGESAATVSYKLTDECQEAVLIVSDNNGSTVMEQKLNPLESETSFTLGASSNGLYGITLVIDGKVVDSKNVTL